jgi:hypothetical protein
MMKWLGRSRGNSNIPRSAVSATLDTYDKMRLLGFCGLLHVPLKIMEFNYNDKTNELLKIPIGHFKKNRECVKRIFDVWTKVGVLLASHKISDSKPRIC